MNLSFFVVQLTIARSRQLSFLAIHQESEDGHRASSVFNAGEMAVGQLLLRKESLF